MLKFTQNDLLELYVSRYEYKFTVRGFTTTLGSIKTFHYESCLYAIIALRLVRKLRALRNNLLTSWNCVFNTCKAEENKKQNCLCLKLSFVLFLASSVFNVLGIMKKEENFQKDDETMKNNAFHLRFSSFYLSLSLSALFRKIFVFFIHFKSILHS